MSVLQRHGGNKLDEINELIKRYDLEEDREHVIVPFRSGNGHMKRCFLLKRRFMRIVYPGGYIVDYPLSEVIEATVKHPELLLSEALYLMHKEWGPHAHGVHENEERS